MKNIIIRQRQKNVAHPTIPGLRARLRNHQPTRNHKTSARFYLLTLGLLSLLAAPVKVMATAPLSSSDGTDASGPLGDFATADLKGWAERSFEGNTEYRLEEDNGMRVLRGETRGQASILYREQKVDLESTPVVEWFWKVNGTYPDIDERSRNGDDFPARLYVVAKTGFLPWDTVALNYVWSSQSPLGEAWPNPFTEKAHMIVVQTGEEHVGDWVGQRRNVAEDFRQYFDIDVSKLSGYAVMVDGDNAQRDGTAWFGEIRFSAE